MPIYDHLCQGCGRFESRRPMAQSTEPAPCPRCRAQAPRIMSAPRLNLMSSNNRYAETRNEKSAHEPDVVHTLGPRMEHGAHSHHHARDATRKRVHAHKHAASRPWMLGH